MASTIGMLKCDSLWIGTVVNQPATMCGIGVLDTYMRIHISALESVRKSTCFMKATIAGAGGDISFAAGQVKSLFQAGVGSPAPAAGIPFPLTRDYTNLDPLTADPGGSRDIAFFVSGMTATYGAPVQLKADLTTLYVNDFLSPHAPFSNILKAACIDRVTFSVQFANTGSMQELGGGENYPSPAGGLSGGNVSRNGALNRAFDWTPFPIAMLISSDNFTQKALFSATWGSAVQIAGVINLVSSRIVTSVTDGAAALGEAAAISCPIWLQLYGHLVCYPFAMICGMPALVGSEVSPMQGALGGPPQDRGVIAKNLSAAQDQQTPGGYPRY